MAKRPDYPAIALAMMMAVPSAACSNELDALEMANCGAVVKDAVAASQNNEVDHDRLVNRIDFCAPYLRPWDQKILLQARQRLVAQADAERSLIDESAM